MARGLDIYTGNIWEAYDSNMSIKSSLGSGGRFDRVIGNYIGDEKEYPAVGVSFGLVPIIACLEKMNSLKSIEGISDVLVAPLGEEVCREAIGVARGIRDLGKRVEVYYGYKLKKAFDYADYLGCKQIAILGKKDVEGGVYTLRDLVTKKEEKIKLDFS